MFSFERYFTVVFVLWIFEVLIFNFFNKDFNSSDNLNTYGRVPRVLKGLNFPKYPESNFSLQNNLKSFSAAILDSPSWIFIIRLQIRVIRPRKPPTTIFHSLLKKKVFDRFIGSAILDFQIFQNLIADSWSSTPKTSSYAIWKKKKKKKKI